MKIRPFLTGILCAVGLATFASSSSANPRGFAYNAAGQLFFFDLNRPDVGIAVGAPVGTGIKALAVQPGTSTLFALKVGPTITQLYIVDLGTGGLNPIGGPIPNSGNAGDGSPYTIDPAAEFGLAFNPNTLQGDGSLRIRLTGSTTSLDLRLNNQTGLATNVDGTLAYSGGVPATLTVTGIAYTNSDAARVPGSMPATQLFYIDSLNNALATSADPNTGVLTPVGPLGINIDDSVGFDIFAGNGVNRAFASVQLNGSATFTFHTINLSSGAASAAIGSFTAPLAPTAFAVVDLPLPAPSASAFGFSYNAAGQLFYFPLNNPAAAVAVGSSVGTAVKGVSFLSGTASLFVIDVGPVTTQLYTVNLRTGVRTPVGSGFTSTGVLPAAYSLLTTDSYGLDFNPTTLQPDGSARIRLVNTSGQNLRLNSSTGQIAAVDSAIAYAGGLPPLAAVSAAAYTNSESLRLAGTGAGTQLYYLDTAADNLATTADPNAGQLSVVGPIGVDAVAPSGLEILYDQLANVAYTTVNVGGTYTLRTVNLVTGALGPIVGTFPAGFQPVAGLAIQVIPGFGISADVVRPIVKISKPPGKTLTLTRNSYRVRGFASDDAAVSRVQVRVRGLAWRTVPGTQSWNRVVPLIVGRNAVRVRAFDTSNNVSKVERVTITRR